MKTINFGVDLGTTNSLIARFDNGETILYNNPVGLKQALPSCVAFRANRIIIGDKALDYLDKDAENVCMLFKRKMGSEETYYVPSLQKEISPIYLSSLILKELKNFVKDQDSISSVVITIPASFDTVQSNATKKAGHDAGFEEVLLLQEPIAACLAFANKSNLNIEASKKWIVYDYGGGTFDVALVEINERELKIIDNVGDNFLGGSDLDNLIVEKIIIPFLEKELKISDLWKAIKVKSGDYKGLYFELLQKAEEAKMELSQRQNAEIELDLVVGTEQIYEYLTVSRAEFENLIYNEVNNSISFINKVLDDNNLTTNDIERIILVGGTTYIPLVRECISKQTGILIDTSMNPTSAIAEGAAYYAGSKPSNVLSKKSVKNNHEADQQWKVFYERNTRDLEELISGSIDLDKSFNYRLMRSDGGYDSGIKKIEQNAFSEFVPLLSGKLNTFQLQILDVNLSVLQTINTIAISHGNYQVQGQLLPNDICLEIDDIEASTTRLEKIFAKGDVLPLQKKIYKTASKSVLKNSDHTLVINIIEGSASGLPSSGLSIGFIEISGKNLKEDIIKGTDIEVELEITESRDLIIDVFLQSCDQEFKNVFNQSERAVSVKQIHREINLIISEIEERIDVYNKVENFEFSQKLEDIRVSLIEIQIQCSFLSEDDVSDSKFRLDDQKRKLIREYDALTRSKIISNELELYNDTKLYTEIEVKRENNENYNLKFERIISNEKEVINSNNKFLIKAKIAELNKLHSEIINAKDENFIRYFVSLKLREDYSDALKAQKLITEGDNSLSRKDYKTLRHVVYNLFNLLPDESENMKGKFDDDSKTGLS